LGISKLLRAKLTQMKQYFWIILGINRF
jgi:hypothetical protein